MGVGVGEEGEGVAAASGYGKRGCQKPILRDSRVGGLQLLAAITLECEVASEELSRGGVVCLYSSWSHVVPAFHVDFARLNHDDSYVAMSHPPPSCRRTLAPASAPPPEKKEQLFPRGGKAMVGGRSFTSRWVMHAGGPGFTTWWSHYVAGGFGS